MNSSDSPPSFTPPRSQFSLLVRVKGRSLRNRLVEATAQAPIRVCIAALLIGVIWLGLWALFTAVFRQFDRTPLEATVAIPLIFNFFFLAMLVLLTLSNALIAHGALFTRREAEYLLSSPLMTRDIIALKYMESLLLSSWSLVLLGLPLMFAMADQANARAFYGLFITFFLAFIPIPGALGLMLAWLAARFLPRRAMRAIGFGAATLIVVFILRGVSILKLSSGGNEAWLRSFLDRMGFVESAFLPNHWVAKGIDHALQNHLGESMLYLAVTAANGLFLSWLAVLIVSRYFDAAYDRALAGSNSEHRSASSASGGLCGLVFFYLPLPLRLIAAKDLRTFFRDPLQWGQLVILFGLIVLYLTNMPRLQFTFGRSGWALVIPFLNLCAVSLILAAFTCRFVFPLISLEGQQLWLIGLLPFDRALILRAKFAFAMTVTLLVTCGAVLFAIFMLELNLVWALIHLTTTVAICFGLCGLAVGLGARLPMLDQTNAARIANGLGGTTNLLASLAMVAMVLFCVGAATLRTQMRPQSANPDLPSLLLWLLAVVLATSAGLGAMAWGARHFQRLEV